MDFTLAHLHSGKRTSSSQAESSEVLGSESESPGGTAPSTGSRLSLLSDDESPPSPTGGPLPRRGRMFPIPRGALKDYRLWTGCPNNVIWFKFRRYYGFFSPRLRPTLCIRPTSLRGLAEVQH